MSNSNILFHLSRGNPNNNPVGMSVDGIPFGQSLGGQLFRSETVENIKVLYHYLKDGSEELFDPLVASDFIKNDINYRCVYIINVGNEPFILDEVSVSAVQKEPYFETALTDIDIAVEGIFTIDEVSRVIPGDPIKPGNPSLYIDDEYDTTNKLGSLQWLSFKKTLTSSDLPAEIPNQCVLKIWIRRILVVNKLDMPDDEGLEGFTLSVKEYDTEDITSVDVQYRKLKGRVSLSNWFDYTITPGFGTSFIMRELLPKEVDISSFNIIDVFAVNQKVIIFYSQRAPFTNLNIYYCLVVSPGDISLHNKYVQIQMNFEDGLGTQEKYVSKDIIAIKKSFYDNNKFYLFWAEEVSINDPCSLFYFGFYNRYDRIAVDKLSTYLWTDSIFINIQSGWTNRRIEMHDFLDRKIIRSKSQFVNMQQIDDLFILFTKNTTNKELLEVEGVNLNRNELLYVFEKDIDNPTKYTSFKNFPGEDAEVLSQRLLPSSIPQLSQITTQNFAKNVYTNVIISNSEQLGKDVSSPRIIKYLLDGSRYVDENSFHGREFKIGKRYVTYEFPKIQENVTSLLMNASIKIKNDSSIYSSIKSAYGTSNILDNIIDGEIVPLAWFQQNVIDINNAGSKSIPIEWQDRNYKDEWIDIIATLPIGSTDPVPFTLQYNFSRNVWRTIHLDSDLSPIITIHNKLEGQSLTNPTGKTYDQLSRKDLSYIFELDHYQPLSIEINVKNVYSPIFNKNKFIVRYSVYFKGSNIINVTSNATNIKNISYLFINPMQTFDMSINYLDVASTSSVPKLYYIQNLHNAIMNNISVYVSKEIPVDPQRYSEQSDFNFFRVIELDGVIPPQSGQEQSGDVTIPIMLYGNGYIDEANSSFNVNLEVKYPFDFTKLAINDTSMRIYSENNFSVPLSYKVGYYDYDRDYAVIWVRLQDFGISNNKLYLYYNKVNIQENYEKISNVYNYIKSTIYPAGFIGAWHFETIVNDSRISFINGAIFKAGDPIVYEKSINNELRLTRIEKEYFYGLAKVYKSNYFDIDIDTHTDENLFFDENTKTEFEGFIKNVINVFKPGYTEVNKIQPFGLDIFEAGYGGAGMSDNKRVYGTVALSANDNVNTFYSRIDSTKFDLKTSYNGYNKIVDWVIAKPMDSTLFKSGTFKVSGKLKSETIKFETPFKNTDYFIFFSSPSNDKLYWSQLCENRFTVTSSHYLTKEISWMAFHRDMFGGVFTPDSIFVGSRTIDNTLGSETEGSSGTPSQESNLKYWVNSSLIIQPETGEQGDPGDMNIDPEDPGYSILLSSNENINMYWTNKEIDRFTIKTSSPVQCVIHWAVIKNGIEWWQEII